MKNRSGRAGGNVALKLDISKAYDRIDWGFLEAMMAAFGFDRRWITMIMMCVRNVRYSISVNGNEIGPVLSSRGLRQGDPLSQYLYVLCAEGLTTLLNEAEQRGIIQGISICQGSPSVSHLLFADDSFLFFKATEPQCLAIKNILKTYERASGQAVNLTKSGIFYSSNVFEIQKEILSSILQVFTPLDHSRYLGLPSLVGSNKRSIFAYIRNRLWARIQNWKNRFLSRAGKEILLKAVAQAIPTYAMSVFMLPSSLCDELQKMMNSFWWGSKDDGSKKVNWLKWDRMCEKKSNGGLGFRNLRCFNLAMLAKQGWRLLNSQNSLIYRIYKARYFPNGDFLSANLRHNPSFTWRGIHQATDVLKAGLRWRVGNGKRIRVWHDPWLPREYDFKVDQANNFIPSELRVVDLLDQSHTQWDLDKVCNVFSERDITTILSIPISPTIPDRCIWHFDKNGTYTVKSGYYVASHLNRVSEPLHVIDWKKIWQLHIPPKVREFLWRVLRNVLPTKCRLQQRGISIDTICGCGSSNEDLNHALLTCSKARAVWQHWGKCETSLSLPFVECYQTIKELNNKHVLEEFIMISWRIWWARNQAVWSGNCFPPGVIVDQARETLVEWQMAQGGKQTCLHADSIAPREPPQFSTGTAPSESWRCYTDAATFSESNMIGTGSLLLSHDSLFLNAFSSCQYGIVPPRVSEAIAIRTTLQYVSQHCPGPGIIYTDAQGVVFSIMNTSPDWSEYGAVISECQQLLLQRPDVVVAWVRRSNNMLAHILARNSIMYPPFMLWSFIPDCIVEYF